MIKNSMVMAIVAASLFGTALHAQAQAITKAATGTDLTAGSSWSGGSAPGSGNVATWNTGSLGGTLTLTDASSTTWQGVNVQAATGAITIQGTGATATTRLTIGSSGINIASGGQNLTLGSGGASTKLSMTFTGTGSQTWTVGSGRTLTISGDGTDSMLGSDNITMTGAGTVTTGVTASGYTGTAVVVQGGVTWVMSTANAQNVSKWFGSNGTAGTGATITFDNATLKSSSATARFLNNNVVVKTGGLTIGTNAAVTFYGTMNLNGGTPANTTITTSANLTLNGVISNGGFTKAGGTATTGILTLSGANTFSGGLSFNVGRINFNNNSAAGTGTITVADAAAQFVTSSGNITLTNAITLNTTSGTTVFYATSGNSLELAGVISGSGKIVRDDNGSGDLKLSGNNDFSGGVSVTSRGIRLNHKNALGTGTFSIGGASAPTTAITLTADTALTGANAMSNAVAINQDFTLAAVQSLAFTGGGTISGARTITVNSGVGLDLGGVFTGTGASVTKAGIGALTLSGANTYDGGATVSAGTLVLGNAQALGSGTVVLNGGTLNVGGYTVANNLVLGGGALAFSGATLSGNISETGGAKTLSVGASLTLSGSNSYTGGTTISAGVLSLGSSGALGTTGTISMNGGTLQFSASNTTDYTSGSRLKIEDGKTATLDTNGQEVTLAGSLALGAGGTGGLAKTGSGKLILSAANTYTGATSVNVGTLALNSTLTSSITVATGAQLQGSGSTSGGLNISGTVAPGNSIESLGSGLSGITFNATSTFAYEIDSSVDISAGGDLLYTSGGLTINSGATLTLSELGGGGGSWDVGEKLSLISYTGDAVSGRFIYDSNTLEDDTVFTFNAVQWRINYNDTAGGSNYTENQSGGTSFVTMTVIPEPGTAGVVATFLAAALFRRRRFK